MTGLTDGQGRKVDFKNTIIIPTTNLGTRYRQGRQHGLPTVVTTTSPATSA